MIGWIDVVSHHLRSLLGAMKLTVLCVLYAEKKILSFRLERLYCTSRGFDLLASSEKN